MTATDEAGKVRGSFGSWLSKGPDRFRQRSCKRCKWCQELLAEGRKVHGSEKLPEGDKGFFSELFLRSVDGSLVEKRGPFAVGEGSSGWQVNVRGRSWRFGTGLHARDR